MYPTAEAWQNSLVLEMFLNTADENYISARVAFFEFRDRDFWWLTLHAVEKYLKASLLLNGVNVRNFGHDVIELLDRLYRLDKRLAPPPFRPPSISGPEVIFDFTRKDFARSLTVQGHPNSRYGTYSYVTSRFDIFQADHMIYWARRHARPFRQKLPDGGTVDWIDALGRNPTLWRHNSGAPLERLADISPRDPRRRNFVKFNLAFFPKARHRGRLRDGRFHNAPISLRLKALENSAPGSPERATERAVLQWVLRNVRMSGVDKENLEKLLIACP